MKNLKIALLMIASFSSLHIVAMESLRRAEPTYVRIDRSRENVIEAEDSNGLIHTLRYDPITGTYSGEQHSRVVYVPGKIPKSNARIFFLDPAMAEELYKELSRVEKG